MKCPTLYHLSKNTPWPATPPLVKGSLIHVGLAHLYKQKQLRDKGKNWKKYYDPHEAIAVAALNGHAESDSDLWMELAPLAQDVLRQYQGYWGEGAELDKHWRVLSVERELRCHVTDEERWVQDGDDTGQLFTTAEMQCWRMVMTTFPKTFSPARYLYTQRADLIVQHSKTGKVFIVDHKTASRPVPNVMRRHALTGQFLGYHMFGSLHYKESFGGVIVNSLQLTNSYKFKRPTLECAVNSHTKLKTTIIHAERLIRQYAQAGTWPHALHETACWAYGGCPMHDVCQYGAGEEETE